MKSLICLAMFFCFLDHAESAFCQQGLEEDTEETGPKLGPPPTPTEEEREKLRAEEREERIREKEIEKLEKVMARAGTEYSEEKHSKYKKFHAAGLTTTVISGLMYLVGTVIVANNLFDGSESGFIAGTVLFFGGAAGFPVGLPMLFYGQRGKNCQEVLQRKDSILGEHEDVKVGLGFDPESGIGALSLSYAF